MYSREKTFLGRNVNLSISGQGSNLGLSNKTLVSFPQAARPNIWTEEEK
jgi:hypothetical protein